MPTSDRNQSISTDEARHRVAVRAFGAVGDQSATGRVGLEPEYFPVFLGDDGRPVGRVPLEGRGGVVELVDGLAAERTRVGPRQGPELGPWEYALGNGGRLTFEPGAQIEYSSAVFASVGEALADAQAVADLLQRACRRRGATLVAAGLDLWHDLETVPQQLRAGRYTAMAHFYDLRGGWGRVMMRHTASLQVNLDLGPNGVWQRRWLLANLMSPLMTASFACSPTPDGVCTRARAWQELDPTRTGFPVAVVEGRDDDPADGYAEAALAADVMLVRGADGSARACTPGFSFERWIREGHPDAGWPTLDDLDYHLTTLFFEVRPRGFLELRAGEALPDPWRAAPVTLVTSLLYDARACDAALELLVPYRRRLVSLWHRAATAGVRDPELQGLACALWEIALAGAERLPAGFLGGAAMRVTRDFVERYPARGRMPADDLELLQGLNPAWAVAWASCGQDRPA